eukprot:361168-Chlamydomonas_euryale.AAC.1
MPPLIHLPPCSPTQPRNRAPQRTHVHHQYTQQTNRQSSQQGLGFRIPPALKVLPEQPQQVLRTLEPLQEHSATSVVVAKRFYKKQISPRSKRSQRSKL